jgi:hypothetical protein
MHRHPWVTGRCRWGSEGECSYIGEWQAGRKHGQVSRPSCSNGTTWCFGHSPCWRWQGQLGSLPWQLLSTSGELHAGTRHAARRGALWGQLGSRCTAWAGLLLLLQWRHVPGKGRAAGSRAGGAGAAGARSLGASTPSPPGIHAPTCCCCVHERPATAERDSLRCGADSMVCAACRACGSAASATAGACACLRTAYALQGCGRRMPGARALRTRAEAGWRARAW